MRRILAFLAALGVIAAPANALANPAEGTPGETDDMVSVTPASTEAWPLRDLTTDRPDVTESPFTVDAGHIQIETTLFGYSRSRADSAGAVTDTYEFATSNLRIGVTESFELDLVWQPYGIADRRGSGEPRATGIGSVTLRAKFNLWGNDGTAAPGDTALALLPYVTLPTDRDNGISDTEPGFGLIVPLAIDLGDGFGLGINGAAIFAREDGRGTYDASVLTSASLGWGWTGRLGSYAEVVWETSRRGEGDIVTLDTGVTYALRDNWQIDAGVNIGATRAADAVAPFIGISARF